ncbi:hypothetical protein Q428_03700 [Fervidicella metallireducens AeB]|uniref:Uncharacterized protein n=1 Tax=Fervidicella metallireducens AeB TaxID=1403537 RepID=A0A017RZ83_9CLOT|nr:hypothetical protein Q428_03700 [Fervidicella metallireducens AeB]
MKKKLILFIIATIILGLAVKGYYFLQNVQVCT